MVKVSKLKKAEEKVEERLEQLVPTPVPVDEPRLEVSPQLEIKKLLAKVSIQETD